MAKETPASRALALVKRARRRAALNRARRAVLTGVSAGALLAAAAVAVAFAAGAGPGWWLLLALLPVAPVAVIRLRDVRPTLSEAALLLDRAAGTDERFAASLAALDPEVRDLVSRQAVEAVPGRRLPLSFPPSSEGLAAVLSVALLAGLLFLLPDPGAKTTGRGADRPRGEVASATRGSGDPATRGSGDPAGRDRATEVNPGAAPRTDERGPDGDPSVDGGTEGTPGGEGGDPDAATDGAGGPKARESLDAAWRRFESSLESPGWHPRFDRVVKEYFRRSGQRGLR
jgi:hypothetical protein